jgi:hypothetical protein
MKIEISDGEVLDKLSILEIKEIHIVDNKRLDEIKKEIMSLSEINNIKEKYNIYYKLLYTINCFIWNITNEIKEQIELNEDYAKKSFLIFELNQQRFRIKNIINILSNSNIKEQKSYSRNNVIFNVSSNITIKELIINCMYLVLNYDNVILNHNNLSIIYYVIKYFPTITINSINNDKYDTINISSNIYYELDKIFKSLYLF